MAYDPAIGKLVLVPGLDVPSVPVAGTWRYDGTTWSELSASQSPGAALPIRS
jgi:hypothetical protein